MITSLRISAVTRPDSSATPAPIIATIIRPTAVKLMKFGISEVYMNRMPSTLRRLRIAVVAVSILCVSGLIRSKVTPAPNRLSTADRTITIAIRIRKITTGWGTRLPTASTVSRTLCMVVFGASAPGFAVLIRRPPENYIKC